MSSDTLGGSDSGALGWNRWWPIPPTGQAADRQTARPLATRVADLQIFRVRGWEGAIILREDVRDAIDAEGIEGCLFYEVLTV